jgi:hypothetical protein
MSYRTVFSLAAAAILGIVCVSNDALAYRAGVHAAVYRGGADARAAAPAAYNPYILSYSGGQYNYSCGYFPFNETFGHIGLPTKWKPC